MKYVFLIACFFVCAYIVPSIGRPMVTPDEFRYGEIPREMLVNNDFTTPRLVNMRYYEKPSLGYWITAGAIKVFGENAFAVRFMSLLGAALGALFVSIWVKQNRRDDRLAALAALLYLGCGLVYGLGVFSVLDSLLTAFTTGTLGCMFLAISEQGFNRRRILLLLLAGVFAGLAFMTKGFIAFAVPGLTAAAYLLWERRWKDLFLLPILPLLAIAAVVLPWAWHMHQTDGDFWRYFVMVEHIQRFTDGSDQHPEPFWFLIPVLLGGAFPSALMLSAVTEVDKPRWKSLWQLPIYRYAAVAVVLPFIFFSLSKGKLPTYILPCFAPLAILMAGAVSSGFKTGGRHRCYHIVLNCWGGLLFVAGIIGILLSAAGIYLTVTAPEKFSAVNIPGLTFALASDLLPMVICATIVTLLGGGALIFSRKQLWRPRLYIFWAGLALLTLPSALLPEMDSHKMPEKQLMNLANGGVLDAVNDRIICSNSTIHAVAWTYKRSDIQLLASKGELEYGHDRAEAAGETPVSFSRQEIAAAIANPGRKQAIAFIVRSKDELPKDFAAFRKNMECEEGGGLKMWRFPAPVTK